MKREIKELKRIARGNLQGNYMGPLGHSVGSKSYPLGLERRAEFFASPIYQA